MNALAAAADLPVGAPALRVTCVSISAREVAVAALVCALVACGLSYAMGRDLNWDFFNYHGYAAFDVWGNRLGHDFFPAGFQGYINRLPYLPLTWMLDAGWHSLAIGSVLAALASLNGLFLYLICRELLPNTERPRLVAALLTVLGAISGAMLKQVGSTFIDPVTTVPVMAAVWLAVRSPLPRSICVAGVLAGAATALKLTNAPFAVGMLAFALAAPAADWRARAQVLILCGAGLTLGFCALYLHWGIALWQLHGSPVFPLFNHIFQSPDFPQQSVSFHRFVPQSLSAALALPLAMLEHRSWVYTEVQTPDLRPLALSLAGMLALAAALRRRTPGRALAVANAYCSLVPVRALVAFFVVSTAAWILTSSNGRYATPLLLLLAPLLYLSLRSALGERSARTGCVVVALLQSIQLISAGNPRWAPQSWTSEWLPADVPAGLKQAPMLFLSISTSSESYVAAHVHPESVFVNPIGLISLANDGPGWQRFEDLKARFSGRTQVLFPVPPHASAERRQARARTVHDAVDRLGLAVRSDRCVTLVFNGDSGWPHPWRNDALRVTERPRHVMSCEAHPLPQPSQVLAGQRAEASRIFDAYQARCPDVFSPGGAQTEGSRWGWTRLYGKHDLVLGLNFGSGDIAYRMDWQTTDVLIGNVASWKTDVQRFACRLPHDGRRGIDTLRPHASD